MKASLIKYIVCCLYEKSHRYVYDNYYISKLSVGYKKPTLKCKIIHFVYQYILSKVVYKDWRQYLRWWHEINGKKYRRYKSYDNDSL